ncbi:hypothetical protein GTA09_21600 [Rhodococcus hoagii]|nr:hypothetical protein [Prescottella equi]
MGSQQHRDVRDCSAVDGQQSLGSQQHFDGGHHDALVGSNPWDLKSDTTTSAVPSGSN